MTIAKYTWKHYGISLHDLKHNTLPMNVLQYEEMMHISRDYECAEYKDNEPKK